MGSIDFHQILIDDYFKIRKKNKKFSIRAFANKLDIDQSLLSRVINGKKELSFLTKIRCLRKLGHSEEFIKKAYEELGGTEIYKNVKEEDTLTLLSDWKYFAIIELLKIPHFTSSIDAIAARMSITTEEALEYSNTLCRHGLISRTNEGFIQLVSENNTWMSSSSTSEAKKKYQEMLLRKSISSLHNDDITTRHHISMTFSLDTNYIAEFKKRLTLIQRELSEEFESTGEPDEVYQLVINLFPLTKQNPARTDTYASLQ